MEAPLQPSIDGVKVEEFLTQDRSVWVIRIIGAILIVAAAVYFTLPNVGTAQFVLDLLVFASLGAFAVLAAYLGRRNNAGLEKKLRLTLIKRNMELENMATRDHLTNLFNRRHFFDRFEREMQNAKGFERPLSVLMIDLDGMREINDKQGHKSGDAVLAAFGKFLLEQARASDLPARIGGDEFAVILPDTGEGAAQAAVNRLLAAFEKSTDFETDDGDSSKLTIAIGVAGYPWNAQTEDEIIRQATASMEERRRAEQALPASN
jgi:diguanylate cyclase (GGDEF)-like protein